MAKNGGYLGLGLGFFLLAGSFAPAAAATCETVVKEELKQLKADPTDVAKVVYLPRLETRRDGTDRILGYDAWVNLKSCEGALIVAMSRLCQVQQVYTRNNCKFPGVTSY